MNRIGITSECVCDVPYEILQKNEIDIIYLDVITQEGRFRDTAEVTARNVIEYMSGGKKKARSEEPSVEEFQMFFEKQLKQYDELIHISISSQTAVCYERAKEACELMGQDGARVHVVDSGHLSSGMAFLIFLAHNLRTEGKNTREILQALEQKIPKISTSFVTKNADYLYYNGRAEKWMKQVCDLLHLHPVLTMKNGKLKLKKLYIGSYGRACDRYIAHQLCRKDQIDCEYGFITYAGCSASQLAEVERVVKKRVDFRHLITNEASAAVSCNCGPESFGILFAKK